MLYRTDFSEYDRGWNAQLNYYLYKIHVDLYDFGDYHRGRIACANVVSPLLSMTVTYFTAAQKLFNEGKLKFK